VNVTDALHNLAQALRTGDYRAVLAAARSRLGRTLRYLVGRLCSADEAEKWHAVHALGRLVADRTLVSDSQVEELLRRFLWALSDESGAVPYGIPEAMAEVLLNRPEHQDRYVPILGSCLASDEMSQTGTIERGVLWGLGRLGRATADHAPHALEAVRWAASHHPSEETRRAAQQTLGAVEGVATRPRG
jgi:hypothetical protein